MKTKRIVAVLALAVGLCLHPGVRPRARGEGGAPSGPPLRLRASFPAADLAEVRSDTVLLRFSGAVDFTSLDATTFSLQYGVLAVDGALAPGTDRRGREDPRVVKFTPAAALPANRGFRVRVSTGLRGVGGGFLGDPVDFAFATAGDKPTAEVEDLPPGTRLRRAPRLGPRPRVAWTFPIAGFGSAYTDEVRVRFTRDMDGSTLAGDDIRLLAAGVVPVPGRITFPAGSPREFLFTPDRPLDPDTRYELWISRDARSAKGRILGADYRLSFGTSPFKDGVRPIHPEDFWAGPSLVVGRAFHTASELPSGDVLLAGGELLSGTPLASCEAYVRSAGAFQATGSLGTARRKHAAVTLETGEVLVCGGFGPLDNTLREVEIWNPNSGQWRSAAPMAASRANHTATLLATGQVLVAGGFTTDPGSLSYEGTAEVYDRVRDAWTPAGNLVAARGGHTADLLADGKVLLAGGVGARQPIAELYDPATGRMRRTLGDPLQHRIFHASAKVRLGTILLAGGGPGQAERYDPATEAFSDSGACPPFGLYSSDAPLYASLTPILGGRAVFLGGLAPDGGGPGWALVLAQVQVWDSRSGGGYGAFSAMPFYIDPPRAAHTVSALQDGRFLIAGGLGVDGGLSQVRTAYFLPSP